MTTLNAITLGIVQGLSEFLPVSSSGHLIVLHDWLQIADGGLAFDAVLHFATALAVALYFWKDIFAVVRGGVLVCMGRFNDPGSRLTIALGVATIPAVILGIFLEDVMATLFRSPILVAGTLIVGSGIIAYAEKRGGGNTQSDTPTVGSAFIVGLFQSLALIPGMSRSGMALSGGMMLGLSREAATRFGFLLAVPILLGAGAKKIFDIVHGGVEGLSSAPLILGASAAFLVGMFVIHYMLKFVRTHSLMPFVYYRLAVALGIIVLAGMDLL